MLKYTVPVRLLVVSHLKSDTDGSFLYSPLLPKQNLGFEKVPISPINQFTTALGYYWNASILSEKSSFNMKKDLLV